MLLEGSRGLCAKEISEVLRIPIDQREIREKLKPLLYDLTVSTALFAFDSRFERALLCYIPQ